MLKISIIIITYNSKKDLKNYLDSLLEFNDLANVSILIIEASNDSEINDIVNSFKNQINIHIEFIQNNGYSYACNQGYKLADESDIYIFSNPDIIITSDIISPIRREFNTNTYGTIIQKNKNLKNCSFDLYPQYKSVLTELLLIHKIINKFNIYNPKLCYITGAFMIFGANVIKDAGLFDEKFFLYYEETDYFYRLKNNRNYKIIKDIFIIHNISSSIDSCKNLNKFFTQMESLFYYSSKYSSFFYLKNLKLLYSVTSMAIKHHKDKYNYINKLLKQKEKHA